MQRVAAAVAVVLLLGFLIVHFSKSHAEHSLARQTQAAATVAPAVDVVVVRNGAATGTLTLPGETAAWYESTIYARVDGYVSKWLVDIGDHVKTGQVLAIIETPELDAELEAARAQLKSSQSQVIARQAEADFSKSTNERW